MTPGWMDIKLRHAAMEMEGQSGCHSGHLGGTVVGRAVLTVFSGLLALNLMEQRWKGIAFDPT